MSSIANRPVADRNARLCLLFHLTLHTPLYWPYMYYYVTGVSGLSAGEFGLLKSVYYFSVLVLELPLGVAADRLGRRGVLAVAAACSALGCGLYWQSSTFAGFAVAELAFAVTSALESGAVSAMLFDSYAAEGRTDEYARAEGRRMTAGLVAATVLLLAADLLLAATGDPGLAYAATGLLGIAGIAAALAMTEPPRELSESARGIAAGAVRDLMRSRKLLALVIYAGLVFLGLRAANALVFNPVMAAAGLPPTIYGTVSAVTTLLAALTAWRANAVATALGLQRTLVAVPLCVAGLLLAAAWTHPATALGLSLHGLGIGMLNVVLAVAVNHEVTSSARRATVLSFESMASRGAYGIAVVPLGLALDAWPLGAVLTVIAILTATAAWAGLVAGRARAAAGDPSQSIRRASSG